MNDSPDWQRMAATDPETSLQLANERLRAELDDLRVMFEQYRALVRELIRLVEGGTP